MEISLQLDDEVRQKLEDQELTLKYVNEDEIQIIGHPKSQLLPKLLFTFAGIIIIAFSMIFAQGAGVKSMVFMVVGSFIGLGLIILPFYNFYSKKQFRILISRRNRKVAARSLRSGIKSYPFDEIEDIVIKSLKMDDYVSDETDGSTTFLCKFYLRLVDKRETSLFTFSSRERQSLEKFSDAYGQYLADFISKPFTKIKES